MSKRVGAGLVVGITAGLLVALLTVSLAAELPEARRSAIESMAFTLSTLVGIATASAFLLSVSGQKTRGLVLFGVAGVLSVAFVGWVSSTIPEQPRLVLAASDRFELREFNDGERRGIEHETLGFRLPHPTLALSPSQGIEDETRQLMAPGWADQHELWAFETADHGVSVVIDLSRAEHGDRASLDALVSAVTGPLEAAGHDVEMREVIGEAGCLRRPFHAQLTNGGRVDAGVLAFEQGGRAFRLVVTVVSDGSGDWTRWIDEVSLACERNESAPVGGGDSR